MTHLDELSVAQTVRVLTDRQSLARRETEDFLRTYTRQLFDEQAVLWPTGEMSPDAYVQAIGPLRAEWQQTLGIFDLTGHMDALETCDFFETEQISARWLTLPIAGSLAARAVLAIPKKSAPPYRVVIAQHGISSSPERVFGLDDPGNLYHAYGRRLVEAGYAVLAPHHISHADPRARLQRMCLLAGKTLWGLEIGKLRVWLDYLAADPAFRADAIAMWGISLGGAYTQFTAAADERIRVAISTAWFNDRLPKMILDDPRYSCFLSTEEEHIIVPGWLRGFGDEQLAALICPRPFMAQLGKGDSIAWWPRVQETFDRARLPYARLNVADRIALDLHDGGHEIRVATGIDFLDRQLDEA